MEIRINRTTLLKGLYLAQSVADKKASTPALANVLLRTEGSSGILCAATDLRTAVAAEIPANVLHEGGISIGARHLYEIVKSLPDNEVHFRRTENNWAEIHAEKAHYKLVGMSDRDFPRLPDHREVPFKEVDAATLSDMIGKTIFSVSTDDTRHHLSGIFFTCDGTTATMVSTDGHRLSRIDKKLGDGPELPDGVIIPRKGVLEVRRLLDGVDGTCDLGFGQDHLFIKAADVVISVTLVSAKFPPYQQVIPTENDKQIKLPRSVLLEALKRVSIMSSERSWGIRMELSAGQLRITSDNPDLGEAQEDLAIDYAGETLTVGFNARYFIDILGEIADENVMLELNGELDPGCIRPADSTDYVGVVMPMRI